MRSAHPVRTRALALLAGCLLGVAPLLAGQVRVLEGAGPEVVVVEASDASAGEVLAVLAAHFQFAVQRDAPSGEAVRVSGRLQGSLEELLERLLRHEGHMIVRSPQARAGIERVLLLEAKGGGAPIADMAGPIAAIKAKLREREQAGQ